MGAVTLSESPVIACLNGGLVTMAVEFIQENRRTASSLPETGQSDDLDGSVVAETVAHDIGVIEVKVVIAYCSPLFPEVELHSTFGTGCAVCKSYGYWKFFFCVC